MSVYSHPNPTRRRILRAASACAGAAFLPRLVAATPKVFDAAKYGAVGDGVTLDTVAIQRAIDAAAAAGVPAQVLLRGRRKYLTGTLQLKGSIDFHLADDAQLLASLRTEDYLGGLANSSDADRMASAAGALILADKAQGLRISGTGTLQGRARDFMVRYDAPNEWWLPKDFRPKMFVLRECRDLEVRDITFAEASNWGLHTLGCDGVLVDNVKIRNLLDVPNCDGIDLDHSRNVEVRKCDIIAGDDAIVIKASRQAQDFGPCANIRVHDCTVTTQDAGLKIGTETTADIHDIVFERCKVVQGSRALCIQLRDEGSVFNVTFRDITFAARYFSDPWWGRGEAISFTAIPRKPGGKLGSMHHITVQNVSGTAENSIRVWGSPTSRAHDISFDTVDLYLERSTRYAGGVYDNRPTSAIQPIEPHAADGFSLQDADDVTLTQCKVNFGPNAPRPAGEVIRKERCTNVKAQIFTNPAK